jgi:hypothetical protein
MTTDTVGGTSYGQDGPSHQPRCSYIAASSSGTLQTAGIDLNGVSGSPNFRIGVYSDIGGAPTTLLGQSASTTEVNGWNDVSIDSSVSISVGVHYWICTMSDTDQNTQYAANGGNGREFSGATTYGTWHSTYDYGYNYGSFTYYDRMTYGATYPNPVVTIYSPTNTSYTSNPINFTYVANSSTDTTFTLVAVVSNSSWVDTLFNSASYSNGTIETTTVNLYNATYWLNVSALDSNGFTNSTLYFTVAVPSPTTTTTTTATPSNTSGFAVNLPFAMSDPSQKVCEDNTTLGITYNFTFAGSFYNYFMNKTCQFGCNNVTGDCYGTNGTSSTNAMWITFAAGTIFLSFGVILGIPYGKLSGEEKLRGFDTTIVVKYLFFFVGLFLMYLAMSMSYNNVNLYGGENNILGGVNTTIMVMMITLLLFIVVFVLEFIFFTMKSAFTLNKNKKWEERD